MKIIDYKLVPTTDGTVIMYAILLEHNGKKYSIDEMSINILDDFVEFYNDEEGEKNPSKDKVYFYKDKTTDISYDDKYISIAPYTEKIRGTVFNIPYSKATKFMKDVRKII
jgi:hypothetical protein